MEKRSKRINTGLKEIYNLEYPIFRGINEVIEITGLSQYEIRKLLKQGKLPHRRSGAKVLVNFPAFLKMLNRECGIDE